MVVVLGVVVVAVKKIPIQSSPPKLYFSLVSLSPCQRSEIIYRSIFLL